MIKSELIPDIAGQDIDDFRVFSASGNNDVRIIDIIPDILIIHRFDSIQILCGDIIDLTAAFLDVTGDSAQKADIRFHADIKL